MWVRGDVYSPQKLAVEARNPRGGKVQMEEEAFKGRTVTEQGTRRCGFPLPSGYVAAVAVLGLVLSAGIVALATRLLGWQLYLVVLFVYALGFAISTCLLWERLRTLVALSQTDCLTLVGNRRAVMTRLEEELARHYRSRTALAVLLVDVDGLKGVNDRRGHKAGDAVLCAVANALRRCTRISDVVGRIGGDEFLVVAPNTTSEVACILAERISAEAKHGSIDHCGGNGVQLSIGVAAVPSPGALDPQLLVEAADDAMYVAKQRGGGQVISADDDAY